MTDPRARRTHVCICQLRNIGLQSNAPIKFLLETIPLQEDEDGDLIAPTSGDWTITGQIYPKSAIYGNKPVPIKIVIDKEFPAKPPKVYSRVVLFHPNVDKDGQFCTDLLKPTGTWAIALTLNPIIEEVTNVLDTPSIDNFMNDEAGKLYDSNRTEYENRATQTFQRNETI